MKRPLMPAQNTYYMQLLTNTLPSCYLIQVSVVCTNARSLCFALLDDIVWDFVLVRAC